LVDCTFTNTKQQKGTLVVNKVVVNDNGGSQTAANFSFQVNGGTVTAFNENGDNDGNPLTGQNSIQVDAGQYSVTEPAVAGYTTTYNNCTNVNVVAGQTSTCTITNNDNAPSLTLNKIVVNDNGGTALESAWTLTANGGVAGTLTGPGAAGSTDVVSGSTFKAGTYALSESGPAGYTASSWTCTGTGTQNGANITLALGQSAVCSITNNDVAPQLTIIKHVINDEDGSKVAGDFTIDVTGTNLSNDLFAGAEAPGTTITLNAGAYSVDEVNNFGYTKTLSADCSGSIEVGQSKTCTITNNDVNVLPTVTVLKSANPETLPEPGGNVTFSVVVTNTSNEPVTLTSLVDNVYGDLNGQGTCVTGGVIAANGGAYNCSFTGPVSGDAGSIHTDTVTAVVTDNEGSTANDTDDATVTLTDVLPSITVEKTAGVSSVNEPGGNVTFTFTVTNTSTVDAVTITSLSDDKFGVLVGDADCQVGTVIPVGGSCTFDATFAVNGEGDTSHTNVFTAHAEDNEGNDATDEDDAVVEIADVLPEVEVTKTAGVTSISEPGGNVTYTFTVKNMSNVEDATLTGDVDCKVGTVLAPGASCEFEAEFPINGDAGDSHTNVFEACVADNEQNSDCDNDDTTVKFVGARISIDPLTATNEVNDAHTFTVLVEQNDGNGWDPASPSVHVDFTLTPVGATPVLNAALSTCDDAGLNTDVNGECKIVFNSATPGTVTVHAETDVTVDSVVMHRETDGDFGSSEDAVKTYIAGKIIVQKVTVGGDGQFTFDTDYTADFQLGNGGSNDSGYIPTGTHSVSEVVPAGWRTTLQLV
jgi:uncharacterized repeat protein (TIGR01451 family)